MDTHRLNKDAALEHWQYLEDVRPATVIRPIPYKHTGSTFDQDGIRITGTRQFIDAVLSRLKPILVHENGKTRIGINYQQSKDKETGRPLNAWSCYIQVHERGREAQIANAYFQGDLQEVRELHEKNLREAGLL